jgi:ABC-2 type transport system permease protein
MSAIGGLGLLLRWRAAQTKAILPLAVVMQATIGGALIVGDGLLIPHIDSAVATYLATGAATLALMAVGLAMAPQFVAQSRLSGMHDYLESFPLPRLSYLAAEALVTLVMSLPGLAVALGIADLRYGAKLHPDLAVVPAVLLVALVATALGYAVALLFKNPNAVTLVANALLFFVLLFTPIDYPISRLPAWLATAERVLPFWHLGELMRDSLTGVGPLLMPGLVCLGWGVAASSVCIKVAARRR